MNLKLFAGSLILFFATVSTFALRGGNGNSPNSGSGGNAGNNGQGNTTLIYHQHGNGTWSLMQIPAGAIAGHAAHGDLWYQSGCPLSGPVNACQY